MGGINSAPTANAGEDQNITLGESVTLSASASFDTQTAKEDLLYEWRGDSIVTSNEENYTIENLPLGEHNITLTVTDSDSMSDEDNVTVKVLEAQTIDLDKSFIVNAIDINGTLFTVPANKNECTFTAVGSWNEVLGQYDANGAGYYHQDALLPSSPIASLIIERKNNLFEFIGINAIKTFSESETVKFIFNDIYFDDNNGYQTVTWSCKKLN